MAEVWMSAPQRVAAPAGELRELDQQYFPKTNCQVSSGVQKEAGWEEVMAEKLKAHAAHTEVHSKLSRRKQAPEEGSESHWHPQLFGVEVDAVCPVYRAP